MLDVNIPDELPQEEEQKETPEQQQQRKEENTLSMDDMMNNIRCLVKRGLWKIEGMPLTNDVVTSFFKILTTKTIASVDGVGLEIYKAMDELFRRRKVEFIDKHMHSGILSVKFEVFLKKIYYMLHNKEIQAQNEGEHATLINCIMAFPCLKELKQSSKESEQKLYKYLEKIRHNRNTSEGIGAHASHLLTEEQLDENIKAFTTLYLYVTGMCLNELRKTRYEI